MRVLVRFAFFGFTTLSASGCASKVQDVPPTVPTGAASESSPAAPAVTELPPVAVPAELFARGRFRDPQFAFDRFTEWLHIPVPWREALESNVPALAPVFQSDAPVDVAVTLDPDAFGAPKVLFAVSFGLKDFEQTLSGLREHGYALERISRYSQFVEVEEEAQCLVTRSNGPSAARLVCSDQRKSLDVLGPYMAQTLANEQLGAQDLFVELKTDSLRKKFGKKAHLLKVGIPVFLRELSLNNARFDSALSDAAHGVVDELLLLVDELSGLRVEATLNPKTEAFELEIRYTLQGERSFVARSLKAAAADAKPAPELFWRLIHGADSAGYSSAISEPQRFDAIAANLTELMYGALEHFDLPQASLKGWVSSFRDALASYGPAVYARGRLPEPAAVKSPTSGQKVDQILRDAIGFHLIAIDSDAGRFSSLIEHSVQVWNDPALRKFATSQGVAKLKHLPKIAKKPAPKSAPAGTQAFEMTLDGPTLAELTGGSEMFKGGGVGRVHLLTSQQGERTWVALSTDAEFLAAKLKAAQVSTPLPPAERRAGLDVLAGKPSTSAGFVTLDGLLAQVMRSVAMSGDSKLDAAQVQLAMPHRGKVPIVVRSVADAVGPEARFVLQVPRAALEDAAAGAVSAAAQLGSGR